MFTLACAVLALACSAASARANGSPIPTPRLIASGSVHAGQVLDIRWNTVPADVDEIELVLSVDGGRHYPIRISAELSGHENSFQWRVPNLGVREARLRLRAHHHGREIESGPGNEFAIIADPTRAAELGLVHEGGWWDGFDAIDGDAHGLTGSLPAFRNRDGSSDTEAPPRDRLLDTPADPTPAASLWAAARAGTPPAHVRSGAPEFRPRRE
jgi:hypothetical protein